MSARNPTWSTWISTTLSVKPKPMNAWMFLLALLDNGRYTPNRRADKRVSPQQEIGS
jgi:hypothetical protein